ncbi:HGL089Wp [Eremothecium sinecaudum]|uniref:HGL089Wp n=1 Tax=Eremothecium sinecaudum TaxID=45286 RepID=A0A0X8HVF8_9SACH|nr:HGL089Wp [Eremothecium sinecaudum]AMD22251.1 HGL089Wp [Eremothecium sinecaudum]
MGLVTGAGRQCYSPKAVLKGLIFIKRYSRCKFQQVYLISLMNISHILDLIGYLYSGNAGSELHQVQRELQKLQKSDFGVELADELLKRDDVSYDVKYFGALTYAVQLNTNLKSEEQLWSIFEGNLIHLTRLINVYLSMPSPNKRLFITLTKLISNLSLVFIHINGTRKPNSDIPIWPNPINTLIRLISHSKQWPIEQWQVGNAELSALVKSSITADVSYQELLQCIDPDDRLNELVLSFTKIIVEDFVKFQPKAVHMHEVNIVVHEHIYVSAMALINYNLENKLLSTINPPYTSEVFEFVRAWISFISYARRHSIHGNMDLSEMIKNLISLMCTTVNGTYPYSDMVIKILDDLFERDPMLVNYELRQQLESIFLGVTCTDKKDQNDSACSVGSHDWLLAYMDKLVTTESYEELKQLSECIVGFLKINTLEICNKLFTVVHADDGQVQQYIKVLLQLTNFPLVPVIQEAYSMKMVDLWIDICTSYNNIPQDILRPDSSEIAAELYSQLVKIYLPRISLRIKQRILEKSESRYDFLLYEFQDFRNAVEDLMETLWYSMDHSKLTNYLLSGISQQQSGNIDLFEVEVVSFLLKRLLDGVNLSQSPLVSDLIRDSNLVEHVMLLISTGCKQQAYDETTQELKCVFLDTGARLLATLSGFLQLDQKQLSHIVSSLFDCIENCHKFNAPRYAEKMHEDLINTVVTLCDKCRNELVPLLPNFIQVLHAILPQTSSNSNVIRGKLTRSIAYIVQTSVRKGPEEQGKHISETLDLFVTTMYRTDRNSMLCLLTCISELGSGILEKHDYEDPEYTQQIGALRNYWEEDPLQVRKKVYDVVTSCCEQYSKDTEFIEVSCLIFSKSLSLDDSKAHFLAFDTNIIMEFILARLATCEISTGLPYISYLLERIVMHRKLDLTSTDFDFMFTNCFIKYYQTHIVNDPDLIQVMIGFVNEVMYEKPTIAVHSSHWSTFILPQFIRFLSAKERFTISVVAKFWARFLNNRRYTLDDKAIVDSNIASLGEQLLTSTMHALLNTQRSDIQYYTEVLRALVAKKPLETKKWLTQSLPQLSNNGKANSKFLEAILLARGSRATQNIVLEWWLQSNGLPKMK